MHEPNLSHKFCEDEFIMLAAKVILRTALPHPTPPEALLYVIIYFLLGYAGLRKIFSAF